MEIKFISGMQEEFFAKDIPTVLVYDNTDFEEYAIHWHICSEIIVPLEGDYHVTCNNQHFDLRVGDILLIPPGVLHHLYASKGRRYIFQVDASRFMTPPSFNAFISYTTPASLITPEKDPQIYEQCYSLLNTVAEEYFNIRPFKEISILGNYLTFLQLLTRYLSDSCDLVLHPEHHKNQEYTEKFMRLCEFLKSHCMEDITLDTGANFTGFSKYHFSRLFKNFTGFSFYRYLNNCRISHAEKLLLDPNKNITDIALESGFNSISAFIRMFKQLKNCTPTEFRSMYED